MPATPGGALGTRRSGRRASGIPAIRPHSAAAGEMCCRWSWYNRAGVEPSWFLSPANTTNSCARARRIERALVHSGIVLVKYWMSLSDEEQNGASSSVSTTRQNAGS